MRVLNPIRTQSKGVRPIKYQSDENELSIYTYLTDVAYQVQVHFEWNEHRPELACDRNENKHYAIAKRMVERGGRRDIFLGARECQGYVEPCTFGEGPGAYDDCPELAFGVMFHGFNYPDETGRTQMETRLWLPKMERGVIAFCRPEECTLVHPVGERSVKAFVPGENLSLSDCLAEEVGL